MIANSGLLRMGSFPWKYILPFLLLTGVLATNRLLVDDPGMSIYGFDSISYVEMARAFPGLPSMQIPHHHAQRIAGPWLVGALAHVGPLSLEWTFEVITFLLLLVLIYINWKTCEGIGASPATCVLVAAALTFNPYFTRFYLSIPTYVGDQIFLIGLSLLIQALLFKKPMLMISALLLGALGRQTTILLLPPAFLWIFFHHDWKSISGKTKLMAFSAAAALVIFIYFLSSWVASKINPLNVNADHVFGLFHWLANLWKGAPTGVELHEVPLAPEVMGVSQSPMVSLLSYLLRAVLSLIIPLSMILAITGVKGFFTHKSLSYRLLALTSLLICAQPMLAGPILTGHPVTRLTMFCLPALVIAFAILQTETKPGMNWNPKILFSALAVLFISSLHHRYTPWKGTVDHAPWFALLYFICAVALYGLFKLQMKRRAS